MPGPGQRRIFVKANAGSPGAQAGRADHGALRHPCGRRRAHQVGWKQERLRAQDLDRWLNYGDRPAQGRHVVRFRAESGSRDYGRHTHPLR
ncbi:MAG: hypothetical protein JNN08_22190 [Bryobacterales bacterium]|nr:hypothetical protein [Bryobacterales bacterium]